jgi:hypothetical protein
MDWLSLYLKNNRSLRVYKARVGVFACAKAQSLWKTRALKKRLEPWFDLGLEINNQQRIYDDGNGFNFAYLMGLKYYGD